jgi:hypothetical protein
METLGSVKDFGWDVRNYALTLRNAFGYDIRLPPATLTSVLEMLLMGQT